MKKVFINHVPADQMEGKYALVRMDYNVPIETQPDGSIIITSDSRIRLSLKTIEYLLDRQVKIILCSHMGRPKGKPNETLSLGVVAARLSKLLNDRKIIFINDCIGENVDLAKSLMQNGETVLLENLRFHPEEEQNNADFANELAKGIDIFVNDAFGAAHRAHASTVGVPQIMRERAVAAGTSTAHSFVAVGGLLLQQEIQYLDEALRGDTAQHPLAALVGGAKVSSKLPALRHLLDSVDKLLIGGAMVYTFFVAMGCSVGSSICEDNYECLLAAQSLLREAQQRGVKVVLASDSRIVKAHALKSSTCRSEVIEMQTVSNECIPLGWTGVDIGERATEEFISELKDCRTILWNGPMGIFERPQCARGTMDMAECLSQMTRLQPPATAAITIICGGDTVAAVESWQQGVDGQGSFSHVSSGGGAALELLEGLPLPGLAALCDLP